MITTRHGRPERVPLYQCLDTEFASGHATAVFWMHLDLIFILHELGCLLTGLVLSYAKVYLSGFPLLVLNWRKCRAVRGMEVWWMVS